MNTWKPVVSRKAYRTGGLVQDRIDSGIGLNASNTMGRASAEAKYARKQASADRQAKRDKGVQLTSWQKERRAEDAAELGGYKALAEVQPAEIEEQVAAPTASAEDLGPVDDVMPENAAVSNLIHGLNVGRKPLTSKPAAGVPFGANALDTGLTLPGLQRGGTVDYRAGGPVAGGPPGRDTVPVVSRAGGSVEAMVDNGEYVLPKKVVQQVGKPELDQLVVNTTGKKPVGYAGGGFFGRFMNRGKQIDKAVDDAVMGKAEPEPEPEPASTSMRDIMREIRKKNPPTQQKVRGYAGGGQYDTKMPAKRFDLLPFAEQSRLLAEQEKGLPGVAPTPEIGPLIRGAQDLRARVAYGQSKIARNKEAARNAANPPITEGTVDEDPVVNTPASSDQVRPVSTPDPGVAPSPSFIRRAGPQDTSPITDAAVRAEMVANPDKYQGNALGIDGPTMARANLYSRGPGSAAFSAANVAQARADAQAFETSKTAQQARTVDDINADTAALRDLRRVHTNLADGRPTDYRKPQAEPVAQPKLSDVLGVANYNRGVANDQRRAAQDQFSNRLAGNREQRQQAEAANAAQDRFMEQAEQLMPEVAEKMPWLGQGAGSFLQRASESGAENARQALSLFAGSYEGLAEDDGLLFEAESANGQKIPLTGKQAMSILKGEEPLGSSSWWGSMTDEAYEQLRAQAMEKLQSVALEPLAK